MKRALWIGVVGLAVAATGVWAMPGMGHRMGGAGEGGCAMQGQAHGPAGMHGGSGAMASRHAMGPGMGMGMHGGRHADRAAAGCTMHDGAGHADCPAHGGTATPPSKP